MNQIQQLFMTPNEMVTNILTCIFAFVEALLYFIFFTKLLKLTPKIKEKIIFVILFSIIMLFANNFLKNPYSYLLNLIVFILFLKILFKQTAKNCLFAVIVTYIASFISAFLGQITVSALFNVTSEYILNIPLYHCITSLLIYIYFYILSLFVKEKNKIFNCINIPLNSSIFICLIFGIIAIFIQSYILSVHTDTFSIQLKILTMLSLLLYFLISMYSLIRTNKLEQTAKDLETEKNYNKTLNLLHDNIRGFKHDFNNIVQAIGGYIALNDMNGLKVYYKNLLEDCKQTNNLNLLNPETINNPSIYSLLTNKYFLATENGINMTFDIFTDLSKINFNIYEFTRILGILLDNAIEAAQETDDKIIRVIFKNDNKRQLFIIENSCKNSNISVTRIFEKGYSTKKNNSGIGLWKVHNILAKNTNLDLFTTVKNNVFTQQLEVFYQ